MRNPTRLSSSWIAIVLVALSCAEGDLLYVPDTRERTIPPDVAHFVARRNACDRWRRMEDGATTPEVRQARVAEHCTGSDEQLAHLRAKYPGNLQVQDILSFYEPIGQ